MLLGRGNTRQRRAKGMAGLSFIDRVFLVAWVCALFQLHGTPPIVAAERARPQSPSELLTHVSAERMLTDVAHLSGPALNGRQTGSPDDRTSGLVVAGRFASLGLTPLGLDVGRQSGPNAWFHSEPASLVRIEDGARLDVLKDKLHEAHAGMDYIPILDSPSVDVTAPVVFVGYGISDPARGLDEYANLVVRDRIVLFLRGNPASYPIRVSPAEKERVARAKGAVAFLTVTGPILSAYEARRGMSTAPMASYGRPGAASGRALDFVAALSQEVPLCGVLLVTRDNGLPCRRDPGFLRNRLGEGLACLDVCLVIRLGLVPAEVD